MAPISKDTLPVYRTSCLGRSVQGPEQASGTVQTQGGALRKFAGRLQVEDTHLQLGNHTPAHQDANR